MKARWSILMLLILLISLIPAGPAFADDDGNYKFYGTVESLPNTPGWIGTWVISGRTVQVTATTLIKQKYGPPAVGAYVEVEGWLQADGSVNAAKIKVKQSSGGGSGSYVKFYGTVESLPNTPGWIGTWVVGGRTVQVTATTLIKQKYGAPAVGAYVEVKGWLQADGSVNAVKIEVKQSSGGGSGSYVKFYGTVESLPNAPGWIGNWVISGRTVQVTTTTQIKQKYGAPAVGAYVEVEGWLQADGSVNAAKIKVKQSSGGGSGSYVKFYGTVESLPNTPGWIGNWVISGRTVQVTATTLIKQKYGAPAVGAYVEVKGIQQADGTITATKIEVKRR